jgi:Zinc-binding dehydrogenase
MLSPFTSQRLTTFICSENTQDLQALTDLIESGQVRPVIDRTYPLSQIPRPSSTCGTATPRARSSSTSEAQARRIPGNRLQDTGDKTFDRMAGELKA